MGKNIVLCADGTGKTDDGASPSNVARLCSLLDLTDRSAQICGYDPGVGVVEGTRVSELTSDADRFAEPHRGPLSLPRIARVTLGLGFGYGLQTNVKQMYGYLCKEYEPGDSVYLFGFSRGAFTVRVVAGIIARCGLLSPPNLDKFDEAFELYEPHFEGLKPRDLSRAAERHCRLQAEVRQAGRVPDSLSRRLGHRQVLRVRLAPEPAAHSPQSHRRYGTPRPFDR